MRTFTHVIFSFFFFSLTLSAKAFHLNGLISTERSEEGLPEIKSQTDLEKIKDLDNSLALVGECLSTPLEKLGASERQGCDFLFLRAHQLRLIQEIQVLEEKIKKNTCPDWVEKALKATLSEKKETLSLFQKAAEISFKKPRKVESEIDRFRSPADVYIFLTENGVKTSNKALVSHEDGKLNLNVGYSAKATGGVSGLNYSNNRLSDVLTNGLQLLSTPKADIDDIRSALKILYSPDFETKYVTKKKGEIFIGGHLTEKEIKEKIEDLKKIIDKDPLSRLARGKDKDLKNLENFLVPIARDTADEKLTPQERQAKLYKLRNALSVLFQEKRKENFAKKLPEPEGEENILSAQRNKFEFEDFLKNVGIDATKGPEQKEKDLSCLFPMPRSQGNTKACSTFAIVSNMENLVGEPISNRMAYSLLQLCPDLREAPASLERMKEVLDEAKEKAQSYKNKKGEEITPSQVLDKGLFGGSGLEHVAKFFNHNPLPLESQFPWKNDAFLPESVDALKEIKGKYSPQKYAFTYVGQYQKSNVLLSLKQMVDRGKPPIVSFFSDSRSTNEDWIRIEPVGSWNHVVNVVGYGSGIDPFDLKRKEYFILRDSLSPEGRHIKVDAEIFASYVNGLGKILEVSKTR